MEPESLMSHSQGLSSNPILNQINPIPRIDTYLFKINSNIVLPSTPKPSFPAGVPVKIVKAFLYSSILATRHAYRSVLDLITLTILGECYKLSFKTELVVFKYIVNY